MRFQQSALFAVVALLLQMVLQVQAQASRFAFKLSTRHEVSPC